MKLHKTLPLCALLLLTACTPPSAAIQPRRPYVAVVVKSTQSAFWRSVKAGVNAAASEYNLDFTFEGPASEEDEEGQNELLQNAIANHAKAIVFSAIDYSGSTAIIEQAAEQGIKIISIDSDVDSDRVSLRVGTDNYEAGCTAARALLDSPAPLLHVGVVGFDVNTRNGQERERGFHDTITAAADRAKVVETINVPSNSADVQSATRDLLARHRDINAIVTFNEITTLGVGHAIDELGLGDRVRAVGFDNNVVSVGMLESGELDVLIVQNPFAIGYLGMENAARLLAGTAANEIPANATEDGYLYTEVRPISREDMYTEENQKFLFNFTENQ